MGTYNLSKQFYYYIINIKKAFLSKTQAKNVENSMKI